MATTGTQASQLALLALTRDLAEDMWGEVDGDLSRLRELLGIKSADYEVTP